MKIVLHGKLKAAFGDDFQIHADSVEDAIKALSTQVADWPEEMLIEVPGFDTVEKLSSYTDADEIHLIPALMGGGGKIGSILIGAALVAAAFIPGLGTVAGVALKTVFLTMGASMVLNGVMSLFMKAPSVSRSNDPDASKYLGLNKNTTAIGTPIKLAWGEIPVAGHYLSLQSNSDNIVYAVWPANPT